MKYDCSNVLLFLLVVASSILIILICLAFVDFVFIHSTFKVEYEGSTFECKDTLVSFITIQCYNDTHKIKLGSDLSVEYIKKDPLYGKAEAV